ncbi:MAG: glycosyl hydrolase [Denitromonas halophila]|nr:MAG: glycosyl hydrolase [Denitromonas halophila]
MLLHPFSILLFRRTLGAFILSAALASPAYSADAVLRFNDPLDTPARIRSDPQSRPLMAVARAGARLIAVGARGLIVTSSDEGRRWTQVVSPVQSDLLAVRFVDGTHGWAVGHDGVILASTDGGLQWVKQLDGRKAKDIFERYYASQPGGSGIETAKMTLNANLGSGPALPWLDVWFEDTRKGYVVGSFGMLAVTRDGGQSWQPQFEHIDNPDALNLNAIRGVGDDLFIAGERGRVFRLDRDSERFIATDTGYRGSFFGLVGQGSELRAFGLRGTVYRSDDGGAHWAAEPLSGDQTYTAAVTDAGRYVLGNLAGQLLIGAWPNAAPRMTPLDPPLRLTGMTTTRDGLLVLTSLDGVRVVRLPESSSAAKRAD